jgi:Xaa-Pro dipeptidase
MALRKTTFALALGVAVLAASRVEAQQAGSRPAQADIEAAQAILAVHALDGWLLHQNKGQNPIAEELVRPEGSPTRQWFYFIPASGQPSLLVHRSEVRSFEQVPGRKVEYTGFRDLRTGVQTLLRGSKRVAMEYAPDSRIPGLTRVDAATVALVKSAGVDIASSAELVQFTKALWGPEGRVAHYVAAHHLTKVREEVLDWLAEQVLAQRRVTERDVQEQILARYRIRGIETHAPPVVAAGENTADPNYAPSRTRARVINRGDLVLLELWGRLEGAERPIYANLSWVAFVGEEVPERYRSVFQVVARARDATVELVRERVAKRRAIRGFEADQKARSIIGEAGFADRFVHRTGHSLDTSLHGDGANLDDYESHDTRNLIPDAGFTVGTGIYVKGDFGVRSEVGVYVGREGVEVTSPAQRAITAILARPGA